MAEWTIKAILDWTKGYFEEKGVPSPRLDAELLLGEVLAMRRLDLYLNFDKPLQKDELQRYRVMVKRRSKREPLQYILGKTEFYSLELQVGPGVLIPRPETEILVDLALKTVRAQPISDQPLRILDIGTGSGAISIALAKELPESEIIGVDISAPALVIARENVARHELNDRVHLLQSNLFGALTGPKFQLIVANPPYIKEGDGPSLMPEVRDFEPASSLFGGPDGLKFIRAIMTAAPAYLAPAGSLILEIGHDIAAGVRAEAELLGNHFQAPEFFNDLGGLARIVRLTLKK